MNKRGEDADRVLAAQRAYVEARRRVSKFGLVVPEAFVRGIRDLGYRRNGDAIAELIDNSLQAGADRIDIFFGYGGTASAKKPSQLAVIDNGHGMEPEMIRMAVMWGGTIATTAPNWALWLWNSPAPRSASGAASRSSLRPQAVRSAR